MATVPQRKERTSAMRDSVTRDIIVNDLACVRMVDGQPQMEYISIAGKYRPRDFQRQHKDLTVVGVTQRKVFCYMDLRKFYELSEKVTNETEEESE